MSLPKSGLIGLQDIADAFDDTGDHNLTEFFSRELRTDSAAEVISNWIKAGTNNGSNFIDPASLSTWTVNDTNTVRCSSNTGHYDILLIPSEPIPAGSDAWNFNGQLDGRFDYYDFEVVLGSDGADDDAIGVVAIGDVDPASQTQQYLFVERNMGFGARDGDALLKLMYTDHTAGTMHVLASRGAPQGLTFFRNGDGDTGWAQHTDVRLLVQRRGDIVHVRVSNGPSSDWIPAASITYDIKDLPADTGITESYNRMRGKRPYGYFARSQAGALITSLRAPSHRPYRPPADSFLLTLPPGKVPTNRVTESIRLLPESGESFTGYEELQSFHNIDAMAFYYRWIYFSVVISGTVMIYTYDIYRREIINSFEGQGNECVSLEYGNGSLFCSDTSTDTVYEISANTGNYINQFTLPTSDAVYAMAFDPFSSEDDYPRQNLYTAGYVTDRIYEHQGTTGTRVRSSDADGAFNITGLTVGDNALWAVSNFGNETKVFVYGRDSVTNKFDASVKLDEILLSNGSVLVRDIAYTGTNLAVVNNDRKGVDFYALDDSRAEQISVSDFYGASTAIVATITQDVEMPYVANYFTIEERSQPGEFVLINNAVMGTLQLGTSVVSALPEGSKLTIINNGVWAPPGGNSRSISSSTSAASGTTGDGGPGYDCLMGANDYDVEVFNYGKIFLSGGAGGTAALHHFDTDRNS
jgi:hypothetical protein